MYLCRCASQSQPPRGVAKYCVKNCVGGATCLDLIKDPCVYCKRFASFEALANRLNTWIWGYIIDTLPSAAPNHLSVVGVSHDTAPLHVREQISLSGEHLTTALHAALWHASECVVISTCNRFE